MRLALLFFAALGLTSADVLGQASAAGRVAACSVHATSFQGWDAQEVVNPWLKLTFVPKLGGRLMQVEFEGHPFLFVNPKFSGRYISPEEAKGGWINYGGDKIWPMPEGNSDDHHWVLASTALDDLPYEFKVLSQGDRCAVELVGQPDSITGLQYTRTISIAADSPGISFHAVMKNAASHSIAWSVQSVSQYDLSDPQHAGDYNHSLWAYTPVNSASPYPDGFHVRSGLADDPSFSVEDGLFQLHWMYFDNEVWLDSHAGWLAVVDQQSKYTMIERFHFQPTGNYPGNATVIFYKNGPSVHFDEDGHASIRATTPVSTPYYMEAEINSPIVELAPGATYAMDTTWNPVKMGEAPQAVGDAGVVIQKMSAVRHSDAVMLSGSFTPFCSGNVTAVFLNKKGREVSRHTIRQVSPDDHVALQETIPAAAQAKKVVVKLFDKNGRDCGAVAEVEIEPQGSVSK
jgi:hypothetical protein